jgi:hypothetical protein
MQAKLQIDTRMTTFDEIEGIWEGLPEGILRCKVNALRCLYFKMDRYMSRKEFVSNHGISTRTLNRCIHLFNSWGLPGILLSSADLRGRKSKVNSNEFHNLILPKAQRAVEESGNQMTAKALFQSAKSLGIFPASYSTFLRCIGTRSDIYQRREHQRHKPLVRQPENVWTEWARQEYQAWRDFKREACRVQPELAAQMHWDK